MVTAPRSVTITICPQKIELLFCYVLHAPTTLISQNGMIPHLARFHKVDIVDFSHFSQVNQPRTRCQLCSIAQLLAFFVLQGATRFTDHREIWLDVSETG